jgi:arylformamidase
LLGRNGELKDICGTTLFLASDASAFITDQTIFLDEGYLKMIDSIEYQFSPRLAVPDFENYLQEENRLSALTRSERPCLLDIAYGDTPRSRLDLFPATKDNLPTMVFVHGGYWRGRAKDEFSFVANAIDPRLANVIVLGFELCPAVTVADIVRQIRQGLLWIKANATRYALRGDRLALCGQSAGAHLIAALLAPANAEDRLPPELVAYACLVSGIYDLAPVPQITVNQDIRLKPEEVHALSPMRHPLQTRVPIDIVVGGSETPGWIAQSADLYRTIEEQGVTCHYHERPGLNHFSILMDLRGPDDYTARLVQQGLAHT